MVEPHQDALLYSCRLVGQGTTRISVDASASSPKGAAAWVHGEGAWLSWNGPVQLMASGNSDPSSLSGEMTIWMDAGDNTVAATQNDLHLEGNGAAFLATEAGKPDCWANPLINKAAYSGFRAGSCDEDGCPSIRVLVYSLSNTDPIPAGEWLYKCRVTGNGRMTASFSNCGASTSRGDEILATGVPFDFGE